MTQSHTPTLLRLPLKLTDSPIKRHNRISIVDAGGCHVADIQVNLEDVNPTYTLAERQQYAAFIVKAVNNHEALVEALTESHRILNRMSEIEPNNDIRAYIANYLDKNNAALAAARGDA